MRANPKEKERLLVDNQKLIHYFLQKKGFQPFHPNYEDLFQECNLRCWIAIQRFDPEKGALSTYLSKVCFNVIGSYLRSKERKPDPEIYLDSEISPHSEYNGNLQNFRHEIVPDPDTEADFLEARIFSTLRLSNMEPKQKIAFLLSYLGYLQQESAELIGISQAQVSRLVSQARRKIKGGVAS